MRYPSDRGFTLIELVVVLAIVGVAMSLVVSTLGRSRDKTVIRQEAARLRNTLMYARETSLMERTPVALVPDGEGNAYRLEKGGKGWGEARSLPEGVRISGEAVIFMPRGSSTGGAITLEDRSKRGFRVEVDPVTGKAELRRL